MEKNNAFTHLTLEERRIILAGIINGSTKTAIAKTIGKDKSTIGKEIRAHRILSHKCKMPLECSNYRKCPFERKCTPDCPEYQPFRAVQGAIGLPEPVTAVPTGLTADSTSFSTLRKKHNRITALH